MQTHPCWQALRGGPYGRGCCSTGAKPAATFFFRFLTWAESSHEKCSETCELARMRVSRVDVRTRESRAGWTSESVRLALFRATLPVIATSQMRLPFSPSLRHFRIQTLSEHALCRRLKGHRPSERRLQRTWPVARVFCTAGSGTCWARPKPRKGECNKTTPSSLP